MSCRHPVIVGGKCVDCGATVNGKNEPIYAVPEQVGEIPKEAPTPPVTAQETPKKATRKRGK